MKLPLALPLLLLRLTPVVQVQSIRLAAGKIAEGHIYQKGSHGFGMQKQNLPTDTWIDRFGEWLQLNNFLSKANP